MAKAAKVIAPVINKRLWARTIFPMYEDMSPRRVRKLREDWINAISFLGDRWILLQQKEFRTAITAIRKLPITIEQRRELLDRLDQMRKPAGLSIVRRNYGTQTNRS